MAETVEHADESEDAARKKHGFAALMKHCAADQAEIVSQAEGDLFGAEPAEDKPKKGGRPAGRINRATEMQARLVLATGQSPLSYLLSIMRNEFYSTERRMAAAIAALPYVHRRQPQAIDVNAEGATLLRIELGGSDDASIGGGEAVLIEGQATTDHVTEVGKMVAASIEQKQEVSEGNDASV